MLKLKSLKSHLLFCVVLAFPTLNMAVMVNNASGKSIDVRFEGSPDSSSVPFEELITISDISNASTTGLDRPDEEALEIYINNHKVGRLSGIKCIVTIVKVDPMEYSLSPECLAR